MAAGRDGSGRDPDDVEFVLPEPDSVPPDAEHESLAEPPPPSRSRWRLAALVAVIVLVGAAIGARVATSGGGSPQAAATSSATPAPTIHAFSLSPVPVETVPATPTPVHSTVDTGGYGSHLTIVIPTRNGASGAALPLDPELVGPGGLLGCPLLGSAGPGGYMTSYRPVDEVSAAVHHAFPHADVQSLTSVSCATQGSAALLSRTLYAALGHGRELIVQARRGGAPPQAPRVSEDSRVATAISTANGFVVEVSAQTPPHRTPAHSVLAHLADDAALLSG